MITFENFLKYICDNKNGRFIFYDKDFNRIEYDSVGIKNEIFKICDYLKKSILEFEDEKWIKLISRDNCSTFFTMFALLKLGFNVLLSDPNNTSDKDDLKEIDSYIYYDVDRNNIKEELLTQQSCEWAKWIGFYSSGTTGHQKKFVYSAETILEILSNVEYTIKNSDIYEVLKSKKKCSEKSILSTLPMYHILGFLVPMVMYHFKCDMVFCSSTSVNNIIEIIKKESILGTFGVPILWELIKNISNRRNKNATNPIKELLGNKIRIILSGGSKTNKELREFYINCGIDFFVGYGMTEVGFLSLSSSKLEDSDCEGEIYSMYDYRIIDDNGNLLKDGEGELIVDTKGLFSACLNKDGVNNLDLVYEKYFRTGDIFLLKDSKLYFRGRKKHIIVSNNGENIFVEDIEAKLEILKGNNILYSIGEYNENIALYLYNYDGIVNKCDLEEIIECLVCINKTLHISSKIRNVILINEKIGITSKGRLEIYKLNEKSKVEVLKVI